MSKLRLFISFLADLSLSAFINPDWTEPSESKAL